MVKVKGANADANNPRHPGDKTIQQEAAALIAGLVFAHA
jgi:hypothetical protein